MYTGKFSIFYFRDKLHGSSVCNGTSKYFQFVLEIFRKLIVIFLDNDMQAPFLLRCEQRTSPSTVTKNWKCSQNDFKKNINIKRKNWTCEKREKISCYAVLQLRFYRIATHFARVRNLNSRPCGSRELLGSDSESGSQKKKSLR